MKKMKISPAILIGGAALGALALSQVASAAPAKTSATAGGLTRDRVLQLRQDAINAGLNGRFYLLDGVPYFTYTNQAAPTFVKDGTTWYLVGRGRGDDKSRSAWDGTEVVRRDFAEWGKVLVLGGASSPLARFEKLSREWKAASKAAWSRGEGLTQPAPGTPEAEENRAKGGKIGQDLSLEGAVGGAAAGAAAGTAVFPGVGTAIGAVVGGLGGLLLGNKLSKEEIEGLTEQAQALGGELESGLEQAKQDKAAAAAAAEIEAAQSEGDTQDA